MEFVKVLPLVMSCPRTEVVLLSHPDMGPLPAMAEFDEHIQQSDHAYPQLKL